MINSSGRAAGVLMDISKLKSYQQELEQMTMTDYLTGLFNRRHFFRQLETHLEQYKRRQYNLCVALLDLDHFKRINDTYGHMAGDSVIREFALLLKESLRPYDVRCPLRGRRIHHPAAGQRTGRSAGHSGQAAEKGFGTHL